MKARSFAVSTLLWAGAALALGALTAAAEPPGSLKLAILKLQQETEGLLTEITKGAKS